MARFLFIIIFLCSVLTGRSRINVTDSLKSLLQNAKEDTSRVNILIELGHQNFRDSSQTLKYLKEALTLSKKLNFPTGTVRTYIVYANFYNQLDEYETALKYCREGIAVWKSNQMAASLLVKLRMTVGNCYAYQGQFEAAVKEYMEVLPVAEKINDVDKIVSLYHNLHVVMLDMEQYDLSLKYALGALKYKDQVKDKLQVAQMYEGIGNVYYEMGVADSVLRYYFKELEIRKELGDREALANTFSNIGTYYADIKVYDKALVYLTQGLKIREEDENVMGKAKSYLSIGAMYIEQKKYNEAIGMLNQSLKLAKSVNSLLHIEDSYYYLSHAYGSKGDYRQAYENHVLFAQLRDSILNSDSRQQVIEMQTKYETARKEQENTELKRKTEVQQLQIVNEEQKRKNQVWLSLAFAGLIGVTSFFVYNRKKLKQKSQYEAGLAAEQKKGLNAIIDAEEKERGRIAKDLHDGIVQDLTVVKLKLNEELKLQPNKNLAEVITDIDRATKEVREIAYQMMPVVLKEYGLTKALEDLLQKSLTPRGIKYDFEALNIDSRLPEKIEVTLYRITQELLNNVIKHSSANFVSLVLSRRQESMVMIFEDNGKGFDPDKVAKGLGMNSLTSRLQMVHGDLHFEAGVSLGTVATIKIPLS